MKKSIRAILLSFLITAMLSTYVSAKVELNDIKGHWAEEEIKQLVEENIIKGYTDKTFRPDKEITRAEFVKLIVTAFEIKPTKYYLSGSEFYEDIIVKNENGILREHWAYIEINNATIQSIVQGTKAGQFSPDDTLTREQMAVIVHNLIYGETPFSLQEVSEHVLPALYIAKNYKDYEKISDWAKTSINMLTLLQITEGYNDEFQPKKGTTRAEAAAIITRLLSATSNQNVNTVYSGDFYPDIHFEGMIPSEVKEWLDSNYQKEATFVSTIEDSVYIAVSRGTSASPGYDIGMKRIDVEEEKTIITFEYYYPTPNIAYPTIITYPVLVVKFSNLDEVQVKIQKDDRK